MNFVLSAIVFCDYFMKFEIPSLFFFLNIQNLEEVNGFIFFADTFKGVDPTLDPANWS